MQGVQPKAKAKPEQEGADHAPALDLGVKARLALQQMDRQQARHVQAEQQHDDAGDDAELVAPAEQEPAQGGGAGAERHEHGREAEHEAQGVAQRLQSRALPVAQRLQRGAGDIGQVARHQRQDAGREERDHASRESRGEADRAAFEHGRVSSVERTG